MSTFMSGLSYVASMFSWGSTDTNHEADPSDFVALDIEDQMERGEIVRKDTPLKIESEDSTSSGLVASTTHSLEDSVHVKDEVVSYPSLGGEERSRLTERMREGKSIYPTLPELKAEPFRFNGPTVVEAKPKEDSGLEGFVMVGDKSHFKTPTLPETGISLPSSSTVSTSGTSRTELEQRATSGKMIQWWGMFKRTVNGLPLVGYKEFWKAMEAFPFSHTVSIVHREDQDVLKHQGNLIAFNKAHENYLEALEKPVRVLQSEVDGLSVSDQVKYFEAASKEVIGVKWVSDNVMRQRKVERDFKSTALVSLIDSVSNQILRSPTEILKVGSMINEHLLPFARVGTERESSKEGVYAQPIKHKVNEEREITTMDFAVYRDLVEFEAMKKRSTPISPLQHQQWQTGQVIYNEIMERILPVLDKNAPKTPEEVSEKMKENLANTAQLLNDILDGRRTPDASWKRQIRELSEGLDFLNWQMDRYFPSAPRIDMSGLTLQSHLQHCVFKYSLMKASEERHLSTEPKTDVSRNVFIERVKAFKQVQPVVRGIVEAMPGKFDGVYGIQAALAFDPLADSNPIALTESDLS